MSIGNEDPWDLTDEELETAFKEANAQINSPETDLENSAVEEETAEVETDYEEVEESAVEDTEELENLDEDGSDQPEELLEESDHDSSDESKDEEAEEDDTDKTEEANPEKDAEEVETESSEEAESEEETEQPARNYSFKANGKDYEFTSDEIVEQFPKIFGKAMDYTKKMQAIKPWRKTIDALESSKISHEDVGLMIDVLKGDTGAINEVLKRTGTDALELNSEDDSAYVSKDYGRDEGALAVSDIVDEISKDAEYAITQNILSNDWDEKSWKTMTDDPEKIRLLHTDVKSGMYKTLQPTMEKMKVFDGGKKSDLDYYAAAAQDHYAKINRQKTLTENQAKQKQEAEATNRLSEEKKLRVEEAKKASEKRSSVKKASVKRKAAAPAKSAPAESVANYLDDSDEGFDSWYKALNDSM